MLSRVIAKNVGDVFLRHTVLSKEAVANCNKVAFILLNSAGCMWQAAIVEYLTNVLELYLSICLKLLRLLCCHSA